MFLVWKSKGLTLRKTFKEETFDAQKISKYFSKTTISLKII